MAGEQPETRYHAEVKYLARNGSTKEIRINIFANTLNEVFADIATVEQQLSGDPHYMNQAQLEMANARNHRSTGEAPDPRTAGRPQPAPWAPPQDDPAGIFGKDQPVCKNCGNIGDMELIHWTDRKTGEPREAWKCQACGKWAR